MIVVLKQPVTFEKEHHGVVIFYANGNMPFGYMCDFQAFLIMYTNDMSITYPSFFASVTIVIMCKTFLLREE